MEDTIELKVLVEEANSCLRSGLNRFVDAGGVFKSIENLISNDQEFKTFITDKFGAGYQRIVDKLISCSVNFGNSSVQLPVLPLNVLFAISWHSTPEEVEEIIANCTPGADGKIKKMQDASTADVLYYKNKIRDQKKSLDEKEIAIRESRDALHKLKDQLRMAAKSQNQEEILRLKAIIVSKETQLKKERSKNGKKQLEKYLLLFDGNLRQPLVSESANFLRISSRELTEEHRKRINNLIASFSDEIEKFKKELGVAE